jgi:hypothetical protein
MVAVKLSSPDRAVEAVRGSAVPIRIGKMRSARRRYFA